MVANVLLLCADSPNPNALGGVQVHVSALARHAPPSVRVLTAYPEGGDDLVVETWQPIRRSVAAVGFSGARLDPTSDNPAFSRAIETAIAATEADVLHVHSLALWPRAVVAAVDRLGTSLVLTLHDHGLVCEEYRLLELGQRFCDIPVDLRRCDRCLAATRTRPPGFVTEWRSAMAALARRADVVIAPSESALTLSARVHPEIRSKATLVPWGVPLASARCAPASGPSEPLRLAVVGVVAPVKGQDQVPELVRATAHLPVEWHWFGATEGKRPVPARERRSLVLHGAYARQDLASRLERARIDVVVLPSIAPETFSLTLSEVLAAGLPVIASDLGALRERVTRTQVGWTFDPHDPQTLVAHLARLIADRGLLTEHAMRIRAMPHRSESHMVLDHAAVWQRIAGAQRPPIERAWAQAGAAVPEARARGAARQDTAIVRAARALGESKAYRDLRLRTFLSESARRAATDRVRRILKR